MGEDIHSRVTEETLEGDRKAGQRMFIVESPDGESRAIITVQWESNISPPEEERMFRAVAHPPVNQQAAEEILDLAFALRNNPFGVSLNDADKSVRVVRKDGDENICVSFADAS